MFKRLFVVAIPFLLFGCIGADITIVRPIQKGYFLDGTSLYYQDFNDTNNLVAESCVSSAFNFEQNKAKDPNQPAIALKTHLSTNSVLDNSHIVKTYRKLSNRLFVWQGVFIDATVLPFRVPFAVPYGIRKIELGLTNDQLTSVKELTDIDGRSIGFFYGYLDEAGSSYYGSWFMKNHPAQKYPRSRFGVGIDGYSIHEIAKLYFDCDWKIKK